MLLADKIALVTGSTHNIGLAIARAFAREGAKVVVHSRHEADAKKVAEEINGDFFAADVANAEQVTAMFDHVKTKHGRPRYSSQQRRALEQGRYPRDYVRRMEPHTGDQPDRLFSLHSARRQDDESARQRQYHQYLRRLGERSSPGGAAYSISKGAINSLTRQAAADLAPTIRVNGLISGLVGTPIGAKDMGNRKPEYDIIPLRRIGQPEDVAEAALFLGLG